MPCPHIFDRQPPAYQDQVLLPHLPAVAVDPSQPDFWHKYVGRSGKVIGMSRYGESAPATALYQFFGITADKVNQAVKALALATVYLKGDGSNVACVPEFVDVEIEDKVRTAIKLVIDPLPAPPSED